MVKIDDNAYYSMIEIAELFKKRNTATIRRWIKKYNLKIKTVGRTFYIQGKELNRKLFGLDDIDSLLK